MLCVLANGNKLPPLFIFQETREITKIKGFGKFYIFVQENAWCDTGKFNFWIEKC